jgi:hypothetical protein
MLKKISKLQQKKNDIIRTTGRPEMTRVKNVRDLENYEAVIKPNPRVKAYARGGSVRPVKI